MHDSHIRYSAMMIVRAMRDCAGRDRLRSNKDDAEEKLALKRQAREWLLSEDCAWCLEALNWDWACSGADLLEMSESGNLNWGRIGHYLGELLKRT